MDTSLTGGEPAPQPESAEACKVAAFDHHGIRMNSSNATLTDTLRIYGNLSLLEMAPVLLAAKDIYAGKTLVEHGSVMALWGKASDLASLNSVGQADIATNSDTQTLRGSAAGPDLRVIFTVAECPYRIVARRSAGIASLADLRGKRIATQLDSSAAYFLDCMLRTDGLASADVTSVPFMAHTDKPLSLVPDALRKGEIDAVALWEPQPQRAKVALGADAIEFFDPTVYTEKFNLSTTQANLDNPALRPSIVAFVRSLITAAKRLKDDPQSGWKLVAQTAKLDIDTVSGAWPRFNYPGKLAPDLLDVFHRQEPWLAKVQGRAPRSRETLAGTIDDSVVREAVAG
jgi:NitT/TauT family transport system substrate-binding protein